MSQIQGKAVSVVIASSSAAVVLDQTSGANPLLVMGYTNIYGGVTSITDNLLQTYVIRENSEGNFIADCLGSAAGVTTVTATLNGSPSEIMMYVSERDDIDLFDRSANGDNASAATEWTSGATATTSFANELCFGIGYTFNGNFAVTGLAPDGSWSAMTGTGLTSGHIDSTNGGCAVFETQSLTSIGATPAATGTRTTGYVFATIATYRQKATTQYASPTSDITTGSWTPSAGATLYGTIDEAVSDDGDYDSCVLAAGSTMEVKFAGITDPSSSSGHIVHYRIAGQTGQMTVSLMQGATTIASWSHNPVPRTPTTYDQTLSGGQADSITDYTDLRLRFVAAP